MTRYNKRIVVEVHQLLLNRFEDQLRRTSPQIGPANALHEQRVAREQDVSIAGKVERRAARRVSRSMKNAYFDTAARDRIAVLNETIDHSAFRRRQSDPLRLDVQLFEQKQIGLVDRCRHTTLLLQIVNPSHVVDVGVRADNLFDGEPVLSETLEDFLGIVAGIDDNRFPRIFIAEDRAIAFE